MIHQYKLNGYNIVLDVCSGSVHVVDDVAYDIISDFENKEKDIIVAEMLEKYAHEEVTESDIIECYEQINELKENGKLFAPDTFEPMANKLKQKTAGVVKALCLHIAHTCSPAAESHKSIASSLAASSSFLVFKNKNRESRMPSMHPGF
jgi:uncharacterized protein